MVEIEMVASDDENAWILRSRNGDPDAFEPLVRKYQRMIDSLCYRMTGSLEQAEDLAQETFIQAYQRLASFRGDSAFSSWLYRIAVNRCLNWRQSQSRRDQHYQEYARHSANAAPQSDSALADQVQRALLRLDPKQRAAIVLTVYDGLNHAEAAKLLGCSEPTVSWRVFAARRKLKRWLSANPNGHE